MYDNFGTIELGIGFLELRINNLDEVLRVHELVCQTFASGAFSKRLFLW